MSKRDELPNPFRFGEVVRETSFCPRPELTKSLRSIISGGPNAVVLGERRTGKTSALLETAGRISGLKVIYAQLWAVSSLEQVANRLLPAVVSMQSKKGSIVERAAQTLSHLRPVIEIDPISGQPSITVGKGVDIPPVRASWSF